MNLFQSRIHDQGSFGLQTLEDVPMGTEERLFQPKWDDEQGWEQ